MSDDQLRTAVERLDTALARVEAALAGSGSAAGSGSGAGSGSVPGAKAATAALAALEQRHTTLRQVMIDSVHELDTLLAVAEAAPPSEAPSAESGA